MQWDLSYALPGLPYDNGEFLDLDLNSERPRFRKLDAYSFECGQIL